MDVDTFKALLILVKTVRSSAAPHPLEWVNLCKMAFDKKQHFKLLYDLVWDHDVRQHCRSKESLAIDLRGVCALVFPPAQAAKPKDNSWY
jgi:hypothetical protein